MSSYTKGRNHLTNYRRRNKITFHTAQDRFYTSENHSSPWFALLTDVEANGGAEEVERLCRYVELHKNSNDLNGLFLAVGLKREYAKKLELTDWFELYSEIQARLFKDNEDLKNTADSIIEHIYGAKHSY